MKFHEYLAINDIHLDAHDKMFIQHWLDVVSSSRHKELLKGFIRQWVFGRNLCERNYYLEIECRQRAKKWLARQCIGKKGK